MYAPLGDAHGLVAAARTEAVRLRTDLSVALPKAAELKSWSLLFAPRPKGLRPKLGERKFPIGDFEFKRMQRERFPTKLDARREKIRQ